MKRVLLITMIILVMAAGFIIWDMGLLRNSAKNTGDLYVGANDAMTQNNGKAGTGTEDSIGDDSAVGLFGRSESVDTDGLAHEGSSARSIIRSEPIPVGGNTAEYEIQVTLCEASNLKPVIKIEYFMNGVSVVNELDEKQLPEINDILEGTSSQQDVINTQRIQQLLLNPIYGQLYMVIDGKSTGEGSHASLYKVNLSNMAVERLFSYPGTYGKMLFNKDQNLLAYSFEDSSTMSAYQEDSLLSVYDCKAGKYLIKMNRNADMQLIGSNSSHDLLYDYELMSWNSPDILRLKQGTRKMTDLDKKPVQIEVLYDIRENVLLNLDGSLLKQVAGQDAADTDDSDDPGSTGIEAQKNDNTEENAGSSGGTKDISDMDGTAQDGNQPGNQGADSEPVKVLKSFYSYLQSKDEYTKAMDLLDDEFKLRMAMLRQFGVQDISKSDIDVGYDQGDVSLYSDLLKAAKLDTIVKETIVQENTVVITYYHYLGMAADSQVRQLMSARLVKSQNGWKIVLIEDGV